jgi:hypothetical protein
LAKGSSHPRSRNKRIERAPATTDKAPEIGEIALERIVPIPARRRGRPPLAPEEGKRYPLGIRTTKALRDALLSASRASGRSLAQEIEFRLERSFVVQDVADGIYPLIARLSDQIGELGSLIITHNDPDHLNQLMRLLETDGLRAKIETVRPPEGGTAKVPITPDSAAGPKRTSRSQRDGSQEATTGDIVDELKRRRRKLASDEVAHQFGHLHEKGRSRGGGER